LAVLSALTAPVGWYCRHHFSAVLTTGTDGSLISLSGSLGISSGGVITSAGKGLDEASDELTLKLSDLEEPAVSNAEGMVLDEVLPDKTELPVN